MAWGEKSHEDGLSDAAALPIAILSISATASIKNSSKKGALSDIL
jgi:hypothetical protein